MGPRGLLLCSKMDWLASVRWNWPQGRRGEKWRPRPTELRRRSMADPAISLFGRSAVPSPPELAEKIDCYRGSTAMPISCQGGGPGCSHHRR
jgi:hypothetical protein